MVVWSTSIPPSVSSSSTSRYDSQIRWTNLKGSAHGHVVIGRWDQLECCMWRVRLPAVWRPPRPSLAWWSRRVWLAVAWVMA
jgi:hypothetical protein